MDRRAFGLAASLLATVAAGCGGGGQKYPDASVVLDGSNTGDSAGETAVLPPPMPGSGSRLVVAGAAQLVGNGPNSCTRQVGATGDRWCAFALPSTFLGLFDLWVINVTQAAAGTAIKCDGSDANCMRLSTDLFQDGANVQNGGTGFESDLFYGDTLIYRAETAPPGQATFVGPVYAWRPGWQGGRKLTSNTGAVCGGHPTAQVAVCFVNRDTTTVTTQVSYDLMAGTLPASGTAAPLAKVDTLITSASIDTAGVQKYSADLSPDGTYVAWSTRATAAGVETLKVQKVGDDSTRVTAASDVSLWLISPDSAVWYWLKTFNYDTTGAASGTLQVAPFPGGAAPTMLAANVGEYGTAGNLGLTFRDGLAQGVGPLKLMADRNSPATIRTLDTAVAAVLTASSDGSRVLYAKRGVLDPSFGITVSDLFVAGVGLATPCTLVAQPTAVPAGTFLKGGGGVAWIQVDDATGNVPGFFASPDTCTPRRFGSNILRTLAVGDEGFLYEDDTVDGTEGTLRFGKVAASMLPNPGTSVQTRANPIFAPLPPSLPAVVYTVNTAGSMDGLYINPTLPFTGVASPPPDAGSGG